FLPLKFTDPNSTNMRAIIIEDEKPSMEFLQELIEKYCSDVVIVDTATNIKDAVKAIHRHQPDLVFLDVELPEQDGFALFDYFDKIEFGVVFTTAYNEYAIKAIRSAAIDYLVKPIDLDELQRALQRAREILQKDTRNRVNIMLSHLYPQQSAPKLALPQPNGYYFIELLDLLYCKADGRYTSFHLINGQRKLASKPMKEYEDILLDFGFAKIHRSHIINFRQIAQFKKGKYATVILSDGTELAVAASRREELESQLKNSQFL
ncbi:MAG: LytTR family DNA-binding domain-containing protein, partial [Bacteroidota bacterium]